MNGVDRQDVAAANRAAIIPRPGGSGAWRNIIVAARPLSRASPLPQWICGEHRICAQPDQTCGSGLAREGGGPSDITFSGRPLSRV